MWVQGDSWDSGGFWGILGDSGRNLVDSGDSEGCWRILGDLGGGGILRILVESEGFCGFWGILWYSGDSVGFLVILGDYRGFWRFWGVLVFCGLCVDSGGLWGFLWILGMLGDSGGFWRILVDSGGF